MTDYNTSLDLIARLVKQFHTNRTAYHAPEYKEADARQELIDPLFVALGWDVHNEQHTAPQYREVIPEKSLDVEGQKKAPDYAFRQFTTTRFFVEAKKPGVAIKTAAGPAYQLRRYAWSAKLPFSLLTDFEELAVYDCRSRPSEKHKASVGRTKFYTFEEYSDHWREIWDVFSREAVWGGSFDRFIQAGKGTSEVDAEFLREIEGWRDVLARNMALRNPHLSIDDLNDAVQRTIDRIIFLRMAEDRHVEPYEQLLRLAKTFEVSETSKVYNGLIDLCRQADAKYNSGLFDLSPKGDPITPQLSVDDKVLKPIVTSLYFPQSPYEFSVLPIRVLGNIYEQFLGKVIRLTAAHQAKVEEKPEVRKAGGVYYTPEYIVDYIVKNTVGKWLDDHRPDRSVRPVRSDFRVLDMACGSGSFLLGAYQFLLDYYLRWYIEHNPDKYPNVVWKHGEEWRLTIAEKKRILTTHIFGVDIDRQAAEVTKLSLLLKVLEGESTETLQIALPTFQERALPNLDENIKCGNSLIGPDYFTGRLLPDPDELRRVNPFDWEREFPDAMKAGGFDCVVGNPPWLMAGYYVTDALEHLRTKFGTAKGKFDLYYLFIEQGCRLVSESGMFGMIVPNKFFHTKAASDLRSLLSKPKWIRGIVDFGDEQVFSGATNYSCILFLQKQPGPNPKYAKAKAGLKFEREFDIPWTVFESETWHFEERATSILFAKMETVGEHLERITSRFGTGVQSGADRLLMVDNATAKTQHLESTLLRPTRRGRDVRRYIVADEPKLLIFPYKVRKEEFVILSETELQRHSRIYNLLAANKKALSHRIWFDKGAEELSGQWYGMMYLDSYKSFAAPHILTPSLSNHSNFALGTGDLFATGTAGVTSIIPKQNIVENILYLLGVLNSTLLSFYTISHSPVFSGGYYKFSAPYLKKLPIRLINFSDPADVARHDRMVTLVEQMLELHKRLAACKSQSNCELYQRQIDATDREIDRLVYELYGLTDEEIKMVEAA